MFRARHGAAHPLTGLHGGMASLHSGGGAGGLGRVELQARQFWFQHGRGEAAPPAATTPGTAPQTQASETALKGSLPTCVLGVIELIFISVVCARFVYLGSSRLWCPASSDTPRSLRAFGCTQCWIDVSRLQARLDSLFKLSTPKICFRNNSLP